MRIVELALQSVKGFTQDARLALPSGYVALQPGETGLPPLCSLLAAIFYADSRGGDAAFQAPGKKAGAVGVSLVGNDQVTYRLDRFLGGGGVLQRQEGSTGALVRITDDAQEITTVLRSSAGMPPPSVFEQLFCFTRGQLPSVRARAAQRASVAGPPLGLRTTAEPELPPSAELAALEKRMGDLHRELVLNKEINGLQYRQDEITGQMFELETKLKSAEGLKAAILAADSAVAKAATPASLRLPESIAELATRYPQLVQRRDEQLAKLEQEREEALASLPPVRSTEPLLRDQRFWGGVSLGALFFAVGLFLHGSSRYVMLLDIPAFGWAALVAIKYIDDLQDSSHVNRKGDFLDQKEKRIREEFEAEAAPVKNAIVTHKLETPGELIELLGQRPLLIEKVTQLKAELAALEQTAEHRRAAGTHAQLIAEHEKINAALVAKGGFVREAREVEKEMTRAREAIALARGEAAAKPGQSSAATSVPVEDPLPALVSLGAELFANDSLALAAMIKDRCGQYLLALSDKRCQAVELDREGKGWVNVGGKRVAAAQLAPVDLDLLYLSMRLALIEKCSARLKVPVLIEDAFATVDPAKLPLVARMVKHLGTMTQVIQVTGHAAFAGAADARIAV